MSLFTLHELLTNSEDQMDSTNNTEFEELLGAYWDLAFSEGTTGISRGDEANLILHKLRTLYADSRKRVLVPTRMTINDSRNPCSHMLIRDGYGSGWNACVDAMKKY